MSEFTVAGASGYLLEATVAHDVLACIAAA